MTALVPIATRRAVPGDDPCPVCQDAVTVGQRIALVRTDALGHLWVHIPCLIDPALLREAG